MAPPKKDETAQPLTIRLRPNGFAFIERVAAERGMTKTQVVVEALRYAATHEQQVYGRKR